MSRTTSDDFTRRRTAVLEQLGADGALLLAAAPELRVGADGELRYLPDADFYYLTGYTEPEAVLLLCPRAEQPFTMFVRDRDDVRERWSGIRAGVTGAREEFGADIAFSITRLGAELPKLLAKTDRLFARLDSARPEVAAALRATLDAARRARPRSGGGITTVIDPDVLLAPLRLHKDELEIAHMKEAARITVESFRDAANAIGQAEGEWEIEAVIEHGFRRRGALGPAFPSIVAGGANAAVLHYTSNDAPLRPGELLLIDAGARHRMYCADVTRTFPVSGRFSEEQRAVYEVVLSAHDAGVAAAAPGRAASDIEEVSLRRLIDGMIDLGLLHGSTEDLLEKKEYRRYFPHRSSHWLGLDVHDVGDYVAADGSAVRLEPGMVLTVEPGLYIPPDDEDAPAALRGIAVRLEDDVLITAKGREVLTAGLPIGIDEVEVMLRG